MYYMSMYSLRLYQILTYLIKIINTNILYIYE